MSFTVTSEPIPARFIGDVAFHTVILKIAVRAGMGQDLPTKSELENKIANDLLHMKRLDEGAAWDVASVVIPDNDMPRQLMELAQQVKYRLDEVFAMIERPHEQLVTNAQDVLFVLVETAKEVLGLGGS